MICPLLSYQSHFEQCQAGRCSWWDEIRQCCAVIPVVLSDAIQVKAMLDSDVELSGGAQEPTLMFKMSMDQAINFIATLNKDPVYNEFLDETPISMIGVDSALFATKIKELNYELQDVREA